MNIIVISGRLTRDPEVMQSESGIVHAHFSVAVNRPTSGDEQITDFFDVVAWRGIGEACGKYLHKGDKVAIQGKMFIRDYEAKDGTKRKAYEISADSVEFFTAPKEAEKPKANARYEQETRAVKSRYGKNELPF